MYKPGDHKSGRAPQIYRVHSEIWTLWVEFKDLHIFETNITHDGDKELIQLFMDMSTFPSTILSCTVVNG